MCSLQVKMSLKSISRAENRSSTYQNPEIFIQSCGSSKNNTKFQINQNNLPVNINYYIKNRQKGGKNQNDFLISLF